MFCVRRRPIAVRKPLVCRDADVLLRMGLQQYRDQQWQRRLPVILGLRAVFSRCQGGSVIDIRGVLRRGSLVVLSGCSSARDQVTGHGVLLAVFAAIHVVIAGGDDAFLPFTPALLARFERAFAGLVVGVERRKHEHFGRLGGRGGELWRPEMQKRRMSFSAICGRSAAVFSGKYDVASSVSLRNRNWVLYRPECVQVRCRGRCTAAAAVLGCFTVVRES